MKPISTQTIFIFFLMTVLFSCKDREGERVEVNTAKEAEQKQQQMPDIADAAFKDGMTGAIYQYYLTLQKALFAEDVSKARKAAGNIAENIGQKWPELQSIAQQLSASENIEEQRILFSRLTVELEPLFTENLSKGTIYKQFCPMAFDGEGAYWFSGIKEINNPYFGEKMAHCGKTVKTIN